MKRSISLRKRLLFLVVIIWMVPVLIIYLFMTISYRGDIIRKTTEMMEEGLKNFTYFNAQKIEEAITISKEISYDRIIEKAWKKYKSGNISREELYWQIKGNLKSKFYIDNRFVISVFYLSSDPEHICYTSRKANNYIDIFKKEVQEEARTITGQNSSDAHIQVISGRIYIIRNLYTTTNYKKFGTLILELNPDKLTDGLSMNKDYEYGFYVNNTDSMIVYSKNLDEVSRSAILRQIADRYSRNNNRTMQQLKDQPLTGFVYQQRYNDFHIGAFLVANENVIYSELRNLYLVMGIIMLIIIPVFIYMICFISRHITKPMGWMIKAAKEIEQGGIGHQIKGSPMPNTEFYVLMDAFNHMSSEVKYLFDYAYNEKIARRDAKIIALQSQINPHFLNNTLEMMNWQARMAGDITVSKMIEALGTLLNYSMDRSNKKLIPLSEELQCVDAYLYIISMRFGQRLKIDKEVDSELLQIQVPQLILQPLIENAVVHGVETVKSGIIFLKVYKNGTDIILQIINSGKDMSSADMDRIEAILNGNYERKPEDKNRHESLGIHNVNERIKLIYGEAYGLTIKPCGEGQTASTLTIPYEYENKDETYKSHKAT